MNLLLHVCCTPCLIYPLEVLKNKGFDLLGLFYNPNIHPFSEYRNRQNALVDYSKTAEIEIIYPEYNPQDFFREVNLKEVSSSRCSMCWQLRLKKTAQIAKEKRFSYFSSTLLVSPYQDQELLKKIGSDIAESERINFYYEDFRSGFKKTHDLAKARGIYCQKYCGCIYSEVERDKNKGHSKLQALNFK